ncbi:hypothetical protein BFJ63_vAg18720 [Fusarium oxysporum f. sp. narcissi]|uniref:Uncharacterized protein n=1 Tax=Fusarium oxysporum f. sp. narcissi TaxID=451672 RepID=A0A4Q2UVL5_FUSOX|nr:hypothetical protein BFJ63_vAg18720 [Fusarium oxysporum f. sp. narcissi]
MPLWAATHMSKFLRGEERNRKPQRNEYGDDIPEDTIVRREDGPDDLDNEGEE